MEIDFGIFSLENTGSYGTPELHFNGRRFGACDLPLWPAEMALGLAQREQWSAAYAVRVTPPTSPLSDEQREMAVAFMRVAQIAQGAATLDHLS